MRVNIISYEPAGGWILYDYAEKLAAGLRKYAEKVDITFAQAAGYEVTFHVNYWGLRTLEVPGLHSSLVTHIDTPEKFTLVKAQANAGVWGLCMSEETRRRIASLTGVERFTSFPPPAMIAAPQRSVTVLIAARSYQDGRKNEQWLIDFIRQFPTTLLKVTIIGAGWWSYVAELQQAGYTVEYHDDFNRDTYRELLKASDYLLVAGFDEGALSTLDAILYDVTPIVSAQGYHLEQSADMLLFANHEQLMAIARTLKRSLEEKSEMSRAMTDWDAFALKHFELWKSLTS